MRSRANWTLLTLLTLALSATACGQAGKTEATANKDAAPQSEQDKTLHALGVLLSRSLQSFNFSAKEMEMVSAGLTDGALKKSTPDEVEAYVPKLQALQKEREGTAAKKEKDAGTAFLAKAAAEQGAVKTTSGLVITTVKPGTGATPQASDQVKVHYEGKFTDGKVFDSSIARNEPATFPLTGVIPCWTEAVQLMKVGGKSHVICPSHLAYGDEGRPPSMPGGATLIFDIELLDIVKGQPEKQPQ